jgi:hypothetical protein
MAEKEIDYEEVIVSGKDWKTLRHHLPFGQLPLLGGVE